jgi:3-oxoacyl-[acyl-carrier protein] reductase
VKKKIALVTGASRGIGAAIAKRLAADGFHVCLNFVTHQARAEAVLAEIEAGGGHGSLHGFDVSVMDACQAAVDSMVRTLGGIDVLVNNAGISLDGLLLRMKDEDLRRTFDIDLFGAMYMTKAVLKTQMRQRSGSIIQIGSVVGQFGNAGQAAYSAAKAGLIGFSKTVAKEMASRHIRVNVVAPGFIETEMTQDLGQKNAFLEQIPLGSFGKPEDVAACVAYLASPESAYVTGQVIGVNGGLYM